MSDVQHAGHALERDLQCGAGGGLGEGKGGGGGRGGAEGKGRGGAHKAIHKAHLIITQPQPVV